MSKATRKTAIFWSLILLYVVLIPSPLMHQMPLLAILALGFLYGTGGQLVWRTLCAKWRSVFFFTALFWCYLLGMTYTQNTTEGWIDVVLKLALLLFPVLFASLPSRSDYRPWISRLKKIYVGVVFVVSAVVLLQAVWQIVFCQAPLRRLYYVRLMYFQHPSYFALYVNLAILLLVYKLLNNNIKEGVTTKSYVVYALLVFFVGFVVLLQSKAGLISLLLMLWAVAIYLWYHYKMYFSALKLFVLPLVFLLVFYLVLPSAFGRIYKASIEVERPMLETSVHVLEEQSSSVARLHLWEKAWTLIWQHPIFGVGTGDSEDAFQAVLQASGSIDADTRLVYNAHSQYLQSWIAIGLSGLLVLVLLVLFPVYYGFREKHMVYMAFAVMMAFNLLVESMFERQAGIMFFAFFNAFFYYVDKDGTMSQIEI